MDQIAPGGQIEKNCLQRSSHCLPKFRNSPIKKNTFKGMWIPEL